MVWHGPTWPYQFRPPCFKIIIITIIGCYLLIETMSKIGITKLWARLTKRYSWHEYSDQIFSGILLKNHPITIRTFLPGFFGRYWVVIQPTFQATHRSDHPFPNLFIAVINNPNRSLSHVWREDNFLINIALRPVVKHHHFSLKNLYQCRSKESMTLISSIFSSFIFQNQTHSNNEFVVIWISLWCRQCDQKV